MRRALLGSVLALAVCIGMTANARAGTVFYSGSLSSNSPTFDNPGGSGVGTGIHYYDVVQFTVDTPGNYVIESASVNNTGTPTDALDTYLRLYAVSFDPMNPAVPAAQAFNDDFTGSRTVLPGPYAGTVPVASTGFSGASPGSRLGAAALLTGVDYFLVTTSFRATDFASTTTTAQAVGAFYNGIDGPGDITIVPEPGTFAIFGLGAIALIRRRRA